MKPLAQNRWSPLLIRLFAQSVSGITQNVQDGLHRTWWEKCESKTWINQSISMGRGGELGFVQRGVVSRPICVTSQNLVGLLVMGQGTEDLLTVNGWTRHDLWQLCLKDVELSTFVSKYIYKMSQNSVGRLVMGQGDKDQLLPADWPKGTCLSTKAFPKGVWLGTNGTTTSSCDHIGLHSECLLVLLFWCI